MQEKLISRAPGFACYRSAHLRYDPHSHKGIASKPHVKALNKALQELKAPEGQRGRASERVYQYQSDTESDVFTRVADRQCLHRLFCDESIARQLCLGSPLATK